MYPRLLSAALTVCARAAPLCLLCDLEARRPAVTEAARILKPGGLLFGFLTYD